MHCCLCYQYSNEFEALQNDAGQCTDVYNITARYFDPILINDSDVPEDQLSPIKILCLQCWDHINNFYEFQQEVLKSRSLLSATLSNSLNGKQQDNQLADQFMDTTFNGNEHSELMSPVVVEGQETYKLQFELINNDSEDMKDSIIPYTSQSELLDDYENYTQEGGTLDKMKSKSKNARIKSQTLNVEKKKSKNVRIKSQTLDAGKKDKNSNRGGAVYTLEKGKESDQFIAQWKPNLECDLCPETATNFDALRSHFREVHKSRFYIKCCDRKFYRRCILVEHIQLHVNPNTYKCDICGKPSTSKHNLKLHKQIVHNNAREFKCEFCYKSFNHKPTLNRHLLTHASGEKTFFCKECDKGYVLEVQLKAHIKTVHNGIRICEQCGKTFQSEGTLKKHYVEHGIFPQPKFPCDMCDAELKSNEALKRHKAAYHHDGSTAYICKICGKVSASEHALLSHKKFVHEGERKYKCDLCEKAFRTKTVLREHVATHTGEDLYQCPHCPSTFKTNSNMHHHRKRVHPVEWKVSRKRRSNQPKININQLQRQVVL